MVPKKLVLRGEHARDVERAGRLEMVFPNGMNAAAPDLAAAGQVGEAERINRELRAIATVRADLELREVPLLQQADKLETWRQFGCATFVEYVERALACKPRTAQEKIRVARALVELPVLSGALASKDAPYWRVRELTRVATPKTEADWLDKTQDLDAREFEAFIAQHDKGDEPGKPTKADKLVKLTLELTPELVEAWFRARTATAAERGDRRGEVTDSEVMERLLRGAGAGAGAGVGTGDGGGVGKGNGPAYRTMIATCRACAKQWQARGGVEAPADATTVAMAACDAEHLGDVEADAPARIRKTVSKRLRENVLARDDHRCTVPGCRARRFLDVHHIRLKSRGGPNKASNLVVLCSGHHAHLHEGRLTVSGTAPHALEFRWTNRIEQDWRDALVRAEARPAPDPLDQDAHDDHEPAVLS